MPQPLCGIRLHDICEHHIPVLAEHKREGRPLRELELEGVELTERRRLKGEGIGCAVFGKRRAAQEDERIRPGRLSMASIC